MSYLYPLFQAVVKRILEQYAALKAYFNQDVADEKMPSITVGHIRSALNNHIYRVYLEFLNYTLEIVTKMNVEFHSNKIRITSLHAVMSAFFVSLLRNFMKKDYIDRNLNELNKINPLNPFNYLELNDIYFGPGVVLFCETVHIIPEELRSFKLKALEYYVQLCLQIQNRFPFGNSVFTKLSIIDPVSISEQKFNSIVTLAKEFPNIVDDIGGLDFEYRLLLTYPIEKDDIESYWINIFTQKNGENDAMFPLLTKFVKAMLSLPHSTAEVERIFSKLNLIKTKLRNRLNVSTCEAVILSKDLLKHSGGTCFNFRKESTNAASGEPQNNDDTDDEVETLLSLF